jgi:PKD repeat protein
MADESLKFKLTVKDHGGLQSTADSSVYVMSGQTSTTPPVADFSYTVSKKVAEFEDHSTASDGTIVSWFWDFGDGHTSTNRNPGHWYRRYGTYMITLTVTDDDGARNSMSKTVTFTSQKKRWKR